MRSQNANISQRLYTFYLSTRWPNYSGEAIDQIPGCAKHGVLTYHTTQIFTGQGCFGAYLFRFMIANTSVCIIYNYPEDNVGYSLPLRCVWRKTVKTICGVRTGSDNKQHRRKDVAGQEVLELNYNSYDYEINNII